MAWSEQAIARLSTTWVESFLFRHHIRRHVFHGVMVVSFVLTATMFVLSVQRFADYAPAMERPPKIVAINVWKAWCTVYPWTTHCQPQRPVKPQT